MNRRTLIWLSGAVLSLLGAIAMRPVKVERVAHLDENELLFPQLRDPTTATSLEVQAWSEQDAEIAAFKVEMMEGLWVIPSHHNYPADGLERMGRAAASLIGVRKDAVRDDDARAHGVYGVRDPDAADAKADERGKRLILKDASGGILADVILGKSVQNKRGYHYVRIPGTNRVYESKLSLDISTAFHDWIEADLLRIEPDKIVQVESNAYRVDERSRKVKNAEQMIFVRDSEEPKKWAVGEGTEIPKKQELDPTVVTSLLGAIDRISIVGVRPQPAQLDSVSLGSMGFFLGKSGRQLLGNEGQVSVVDEDGVVYTLFFGDITALSGRALTAGLIADSSENSTEEADSGDKKDKKGKKNKRSKKKKAKKPEAPVQGDNRFMFVNISYDPALDRNKPVPAAEDGSTGEASAKVDAAADSTASLPAGSSAPGISTQGTSDAKQKAKIGGEERAQAIAKRFDKWFYVISNASFQQIRKEPAAFFKDQPPEAKPDP